MLLQSHFKLFFGILLGIICCSCNNSPKSYEDEDDDIYNNYGNLIFCPTIYTDTWNGKKPTKQQLSYFKDVICKSCLLAVYKGENWIGMRFITVDTQQKISDTTYVTPVFTVNKLQYRHRYGVNHTSVWQEAGLAKGYINGKLQGTIFFDNYAYFKMSNTFNVIIELYVVPPTNLHIHSERTESHITLMDKYLDMHNVH